MCLVERFSSIRTRRNGASTLRINMQIGKGMLYSSNHTNRQSKSPHPPPSEYARLIIETSNLLHTSFQTLLELQVRRVLLQIILPVLLSLEFHHETILIYRLNSAKAPSSAQPQSPTAQIQKL